MIDWSTAISTRLPGRRRRKALVQRKSPLQRTEDEQVFIHTRGTLEPRQGSLGLHQAERFHSRIKHKAVGASRCKGAGGGCALSLQRCGNGRGRPCRHWSRAVRRRRKGVRRPVGADGNGPSLPRHVFPARAFAGAIPRHAAPRLGRSGGKAPWLQRGGGGDEQLPSAGFYTRHGYQEFGRVDFGVGGHARIFLHRHLA